MSDKVRIQKKDQVMSTKGEANAMEQLDFDKLRYFVKPSILRVNLYFVLFEVILWIGRSVRSSGNHLMILTTVTS